MRPWGVLHKGSAKGLLLGRPGLRASGNFLETEGRGAAPLALVSSAGQEGVEGVDQLEVRRKRPQLPGQARPLSSNLVEETQAGRGLATPGHTWSHLGPKRVSWGDSQSGLHHARWGGERSKDHWGLDCPKGSRRLLSPGRAPNFGGRKATQTLTALPKPPTEKSCKRRDAQS